MSAILGVNFTGADPNAALVLDGEPFAAAEEERFVRRKHAVDCLPERAVAFCLAEAEKAGRKLDAVAFGWDGERYENGEMNLFYEEHVNSVYAVDEATRGWQRRMIDSFRKQTVAVRIQGMLREAGIIESPPIHFLGHHETHATGAFLLSPFEEAAILTLDGSGEEVCTALWAASGEGLRLLRTFPIPHSLGWFYAAMTEYLGFRAYNGEYKVMGLAPYGKPDPRIRAALGKVLSIDDQGYRLEPAYIHYGSHTYSGRFTDALVDLLGVPPRRRDAEPAPFYQSVACEAQRLFEEAAVRLAAAATLEAGSGNICLAGGSALNCKMSQRILESGCVDDIFILPNAGDGGQALSAALTLHQSRGGSRPRPIRTMALGPAFAEAEIGETLAACLLRRNRVSDPAEEAAADLAAGRVVGWFQGRMEFGPRALGQRSILADPRSVAARDRVNQVVKYREQWRPFCPSLPVDKASSYFAKVCDARFMAITLPVTSLASEEIPAVVHVDRTSRPQFVHREEQPLFHRLLDCFGRKTGVPVLLNTSFNLKGEPIVCTPRDALRTFYSSGMEILYLGPFRLAKQP